MPPAMARARSTTHLSRCVRVVSKIQAAHGKSFADAGAVIREGLNAYVKEVTEKTFPAQENWFGMPDEEYDELLKMLE